MEQRTDELFSISNNIVLKTGIFYLVIGIIGIILSSIDLTPNEPDYNDAFTRMLSLVGIFFGIGKIIFFFKEKPKVYFFENQIVSQSKEFNTLEIKEIHRISYYFFLNSNKLLRCGIIKKIIFLIISPILLIFTIITNLISYLILKDSFNKEILVLVSNTDDNFVYLEIPKHDKHTYTKIQTYLIKATKIDIKKLKKNWFIPE